MQMFSDRESKVPKFNYPDTFSDQISSLEKDHLIQRLSQSRSTYKDDPHRPIFHYVNPENTLNDPNGICFWKGYWHLFYQAYPPEDPRQHWGHAYSSDLVHWKDLPYAIYPNPEEACFSGATFVENNKVIAMYHGTKVGNMIAISDDDLLLNWEKINDKKPVIKIQTEDGPKLPYRVFDPCIWKKDKYYYSLSGGTLPHNPSGRRTRANFLFRSKNLINWEYMHPFIEGDNFTKIGDDGACPYFWPIGDRYILYFFSHMSGGQALLGDYDIDNDKFIVTSHHEFNFGAAHPGGVHAPSATTYDNGKNVVIFNMNHSKETVGWNQLMTLPREIGIAGKDKINKDVLTIKPAGNIESLRKNHRSIKNILISPNEEKILENISGNSIEILLTAEVKDASMFELRVLRSNKSEEFTRITFYKNRGFRDWEKYEGWDLKKRLNASDSMISLDTSYSSLDQGVLSRPPEVAPVYLSENENLDLRIFIDRSVIEIFVNERQCVASRLYPSRNDSIGVSAISQGSSSKILSLDAYDMENIYQN